MGERCCLKTASTRYGIDAATPARTDAIGAASSVGESIAVGQRVGLAELAGTRCSNPAIAVDSSDLTLPVGSAGTTSARVSCIIKLSDLLVPGMPGSFHIESVAHSTLDSHRERYS